MPDIEPDDRWKPRRHLRDAATICPATLRLTNGLVLNRCERDAGHDGKRKDGCTHWGSPATAPDGPSRAPAASARPSPTSSP